MISTELLIVMVIFLIYIGIWMSYMDSFMEAVQQAMGRLEQRAILDTVVHKANIACVTTGEQAVDFGKEIEIRTSGKLVTVGGASREADCEFAEDYALHSSKISIRKENGVIVVNPN